MASLQRFLKTIHAARFLPIYLLCVGPAAFLWSKPVLLVVLYIILAVALLIRWHSRTDLIYFAVPFVLGPAGETLAVTYGAWSYSGVRTLLPVWLPFVWGIAGLFMKKTCEALTELGDSEMTSPKMELEIGGEVSDTPVSKQMSAEVAAVSSTSGSSRGDSPKEWFVKEYGIIVEERRFLMTRYMQGFAFYVAIIALSIRELLLVKDSVYIVSLWVFLTGMHALCFWACIEFKKLATPVIEREAELALRLEFQQMEDHYWGFWVVVFIFMLAELVATALALIKLQVASFGG